MFYVAIVLRQLQATSSQAEHILWLADLTDFVGIKNNAELTILQLYPYWQPYAILKVVFRYVLYVYCLYLMLFQRSLLVALLVWDRDMHKSMHVIFPIIQVNLCGRRASKKFLVPVSKLKVDGMVVCCALGWSWSCYMHAGLTLPYSTQLFFDDGAKVTLHIPYRWFHVLYIDCNLALTYHQKC